MLTRKHKIWQAFLIVQVHLAINNNQVHQKYFNAIDFHHIYTFPSSKILI